MVARSDQISGLDYNLIRTKIVELLGPGAGTYGYGQDLNSTAVTSGMVITELQWDNLRYDITNIILHQDGLIPTIPDVGTSTVIAGGLGDPANYYSALLDLAQPKRFQIANGQYLLNSISTKTTTTPWSSSATATITATFVNAAHARYFFNAGGKVRLSSTRTGGAGSAQNNAWTNLLSSVGDRDFGADAQPLVNYYDLTTSYQIYYQESSTTPYSANNIRLEAKCNVANNSTGTATEITLRVTWSDSYVDPGAPAPGDLVDGTLSLFVEEIIPAGYLKPNDDPWDLSSPIYSVSSISVS